MSDVLNAPPIDGRHHYPTHPPGTAAYPEGTPAGSTVELEDVPGAVIPADWLHESSQGRTVGRKRLRLLLTHELFCSLVTGHLSATLGDPTATRRWCWRQTDALLAESDDPPLSTPPAAALPLPAVRYLHWLVTHGPAYPTEGPPGSDPATHGGSRRVLFKAGLACWRDNGGGDRVAATAQGHALFAGSPTPVGEVA